MKRIVKTIVLTIAAAVTCGCTGGRYFTFGGYAQGGTYKVTCRGAKEHPAVIKDSVETILHDIDFTLSGYNKASLLSRLNAGDTVTLNPMFARLYRVSYEMWEDSKGAFDVAAGPLFDIWGFGFTADSLPDPARIAQTLKECGMARLKGPDEVEAFAANGTPVTSQDLLKQPGTLPRLNFNAIAQGFSSDVIAEFLKRHGAKDMLVDIGEIYACGLNPYGKTWNIGIDNPFDGNQNPGADIRDTWACAPEGCGIVTSGNYRKFYVRNGVKYSHTIDPRTGYPVQHNLLSATVVAPDATTADALATRFMVEGFDAARDYILANEKIDGVLITADSLWSSR